MELIDIEVAFEHVKPINMILQQNSKEQTWYDEAGTAIPYSRTTRVERLLERSSGSILKDAEKINKELRLFKQKVRELCDEAYEAFMEEKGIEQWKDRKGNFTWYNFNRSIKIEVSVNERTEFDDLTIQAAKAKLDEFLSEAIQSKNEFAKQMVIDAFETQRNKKLDTRKVLNLTRYEDKVNDPLFSEAVSLIKKAIRTPDSRTYFRVWKMDGAGEYQNVELNFSSI